MSRSTGVRVQTSGAVKPPSEWPTTTTFRRAATASTTAAGVSPPAGRLRLAREIDRYGVMSALLQLGHDQMPVPRASSASVNKRERRHGRQANEPGREVVRRS